MSLARLSGFAIAMILAATTAIASGGGPMSGGNSAASFEPRELTPEEQAKQAYNTGIKWIKKAKDYDADAEKASTPEKKSKACQKWDGRIHRIHLDDKENPYNTYAHEGLPPGPISNPGRAALEAVLAPDSTPYLYFVSKNDGTHYFSKTVAEHEAAVDRYQRHATPGGGGGT